MTIEPALAELAAAYGVAVAYTDQLERTVHVNRESVLAVLAALGVDPTGPPPSKHHAPDSVVLRQSKGATVAVGGPALLRLEDGTRRQVANDGGHIGLPPGLPLGWHVLETGDRPVPVIVTPDRLDAPAGRHWGWMLQLYATPSADSWGVGDLGDLATFARWTGAYGGGLVVVNPLHAVAPQTPMQPSPYYPASRRWTNPLYLRIENTPEYVAATPEVREKIDALRMVPHGDRIDRDPAWAAKVAALELLWPSARPRAMTDDLRDFATWCALTEVHGGDWREWPAQLRRPDGPGIVQARADLDDRIRFHAWLQLLCAEQLASAQDGARAAGLSLGIVHDLAVGCDPAGADAWMLQEALALRARIGAPPDTFNQQGQDWGMPPWHPQRLARLGYAPLREMVRAVLAHAGGVRIDHALGLFRMWWIPEGGSARDGTYVSYDAEAMLGVILLEAHRAGAVVIGEDLGTVPPAVRRTLSERGVSGTSVLWFEREKPADGRAGPLRPLDKWRESVTATVTTHDLPTALGWLRGEHVRIRAELGLLDDPEREQQTWLAERAELLEFLHRAGLLGVESTEDEQVLALHLALTQTPCRYVLAAPGDAVGDLRQPNVPGTVDEYPNWRLAVTDVEGRPMRLDELLADARVGRLVSELSRAVR